MAPVEAAAAAARPVAAVEAAGLAGGGGSAASGGGGGGGGGSSSGGGAAGARASSGGEATRTPAQRRRRKTRKLERTVARLSGCLDQLSTGQRRVLVLRAGIGSARAHSRRGVARTLDISVRRVRRLERGGLREARALARDGGCGGSSQGGTGAATAGIVTSGGGDAGAGTDGAAADHGKDGDAAGGREPSSSTDEGGVRGESDSRVPPLPQGDNAPAGGVTIALSILLIALAGMAGYATPHLRGRLRSN